MAAKRAKESVLHFRVKLCGYDGVLPADLSFHAVPRQWTVSLGASSGC